MPKTTIPAPAQVIAENIEQLKAEITNAERSLLEQRTENADFSEVLKLLSVGAAPFVASGRLPLMDAVSALLDEATNVQDREYRWSVTQKALSVGQQAAESIDAELQKLRQQLAIALDELDWQTNYQPRAEQFRNGFQQPSPQDIKDEKVAALQADISQRRSQLQRAQLWLSQPEGSRPYYSGNPAQEVQYLSQAIPLLSQQLKRLVSESVALDERYEAAFRQYVKGRVAVQPALDAFLTAQAAYLSALAEFKLAIAQHRIAAEFEPVALGEPRIVVAESSIKLI